MPYCPKCGIEVEYKIKTCPLCSFEIPEVYEEIDAPEQEIELKNYYNELKHLKKTQRKRSKQVIFIIILLVTIGVAFNNFMQDWIGNEELTFSPYVLSSIGLFVICLLPIFGFIKGWKKVIFLIFIGTTAFLFSIDFYYTGLEWFLPMGLPLSCIFFSFLFFINLIIRKLKPGKIYSWSIVLSASAIILILLEVILDLFFSELNLEWSLQTLVPLGSLAALLILGKHLVHRDATSKLKRYMHL